MRSTPTTLLTALAKGTLTAVAAVVAVVVVVLAALGSWIFAVSFTVRSGARRLVGRLPGAHPAQQPTFGSAGYVQGAAAVQGVSVRNAVLGAACLAALMVPGFAPADTSQGGADSLSAATPLSPGATVTGAFARPDDVDYLTFIVDKPNTALRFTVRNTVGKCSKDTPSQLPCPIWATLLDGNAQQLGGEGSSAGTGQVNAGATDTIDWTFANPGTYYVAMDSAGDFPTYAVSYAVVQPKPALTSLTASSPQRGTAVRSRVTLGRPVKTLTGKLTLRASAGGIAKGKAVGRTVLSQLAPGSRTLTVKLTVAGRAALKKARKFSLRLRATAVPATGDTVSKTRLLTLKAP